MKSVVTMRTACAVSLSTTTIALAAGNAVPVDESGEAARDECERHGCRCERGRLAVPHRRVHGRRHSADARASADRPDPRDGDAQHGSLGRCRRPARSPGDVRPADGRNRRVRLPVLGQPLDGRGPGRRVCGRGRPGRLRGYVPGPGLRHDVADRRRVAGRQPVAHERQAGHGIHRRRQRQPDLPRLLGRDAGRRGRAHCGPLRL